jgi:hypothetical protein
MWGILHRQHGLRGAVFGVLAFVLLLPSVLGGLSTPELVREQALYSELQRSLCAGNPDKQHDGAPTPLSGCDFCCSACTVGCAVPSAAVPEIGRAMASLPTETRLVAAHDVVVDIGRPGERLPRGPPAS